MEWTEPTEEIEEIDFGHFNIICPFFGILYEISQVINMTKLNSQALSDSLYECND